MGLIGHFLFCQLLDLLLPKCHLQLTLQKSTNLHSCFLHVAVLGCSAVESNRRNIDLVLAPFCCISRSLFHCFAVSADRFGFTSFGSVLKPGRYLGCHLALRLRPFFIFFVKVIFLVLLILRFKAFVFTAQVLTPSHHLGGATSPSESNLWILHIFGNLIFFVQLGRATINQMLGCKISKV